MDKENRNCFVYKHTNKINGKCYIGAVFNGRDPQKRWGVGGKNYINNKQTKFENAILKYGWDCFNHEILFSGLTAKEAKNKEKELIEKYDSFKNGYNSTLGGDGVLGIRISENTKQILRQKRLGRKASEETKRKISLAEKEFRRKLTKEERRKIFGQPGKENGMFGKHRYGKENPFYGKKHSEETKEKISKAKTGTISKKRKQIIQYDLEMNFIKEWPSIASVDSLFKHSSGRISDCCNHKRKTAYGYIWRFKEQNNGTEKISK